MQVSSWSANSSLKSGFVLGTQLRLDSLSRLHHASISVAGRNALRTITGIYIFEFEHTLGMWPRNVRLLFDFLLLLSADITFDIFIGRVVVCDAAAFDPELHSVLELASDAELSELSSILYGQRSVSSLFSGSGVEAFRVSLKASAFALWFWILENQTQTSKNN